MQNSSISVQVEKASPILRKLKITVPASRVSARFETKLKEAQRTANLKGFRKGMVPIAVVKQYYGEDIKHRVFHDLVDESFDEAVRDHQIRPVGRPTIETAKGNTHHGEDHGHADHGIEEGQDLSFTATVDVIPEIELKSYSGFTFTREKSELEKGEVEKFIEQARESHAEISPVARAAKKTDYVDFTFKGGIIDTNGKLELRKDMEGARVIEIGGDQLIPGFEDQLVGLSAGGEKTFRLTFPADFPEASLQSKEAEFSVQIKEVKEKKLPEVNDDLAKTLGYDDLKDMRAKFEERLANNKKAQSERKLRADLIEELIKKNPFDVPQSLIQAQARVNLRDLIENLRQQGFNDQMIAQAVATEQESLQKRAESQVRAGLILEAVGKKEGVKVDPSDFDAEYKKIALSTQMKEADVSDYYEKNREQKSNLEFRIREEKAISLVLSKSKVKG